MRVLVLGSKGMLGHKMLERLQNHYPDVVGASRKDFDATDEMSVRSLLLRHWPEMVVNCVGIIKQREQEPKMAFAVNAGLPHLLQYACYEQGSRLIHFSTDCVFSGEQGQYTEKDQPDAKDVYGVTKHMGEISKATNAITLRTSIIGRERNNYLGLLEWFLKQKGVVDGYTNAVFSGVTTNWLSDIVAESVMKTNLFGLYNVASPPVSKFELLQMFRDVYKRDVSIVPKNEPRCDRSLIGRKFEESIGIKTPTLMAQIAGQQYQDRGKYDIQ